VTAGATGPADDAGVPAFWRALGLPGLADVHVHFLPPRMQERVWAHFAEPSPLIGRDWPISYRWPVPDRLARLRELGVRAFSALPYAHRPGMATELNAWAAGFATANPDCLRSATFYPEPGAPGYVRDALAGGTRVFKVHLQVGGFDPAEPALEEVWGLLAEAGTPVVVHAGSGPVGGPFTGPGPISTVLARHPLLRVVVAHLGTPEYADFLALAERYERVCLDTTMGFTDFTEAAAPYPRDLLPRLGDLGLAGKVLLGSDFPNIPYPYAHQLAALAGLGLGDEWLRAVCWRTAANLFDLAA
jgi:predicted TIM-barrel fold metal-dependent hydrolase